MCPHDESNDKPVERLAEIVNRLEGWKSKAELAGTGKEWWLTNGSILEVQCPIKSIDKTRKDDVQRK